MSTLGGRKPPELIGRTMRGGGVGGGRGPPGLMRWTTGVSGVCLPQDMYERPTQILLLQWTSPCLSEHSSRGLGFSCGHCLRISPLVPRHPLPEYHAWSSSDDGAPHEYRDYRLEKRRKIWNGMTDSNSHGPDVEQGRRSASLSVLGCVSIGTRANPRCPR